MIDKKLKEDFIQKCKKYNDKQMISYSKKENIIKDTSSKNKISVWRVNSSGDVFIISGENNA